MATLHLEIVTPDSKIYDEEVESVVLPGAEGEMGILPMHVPLMTQLQPGELRISKQGKTTSLAIGEGFAQVLPNKVSVLTDLATETEKIDEAKMEEAINRFDRQETRRGAPP